MPIHPLRAAGQSADQDAVPQYVPDAGLSHREFELARRRVPPPFSETVPVVQHGIDTAKFHTRPKLSAQDGVIRVVTYCRPEKWKGFQDAVPAMAELMRRYPNKIEWHVYGFAASGFRAAAMNSLPTVSRRRSDHDELSRLYAESDIVLCPSWYESFPLPPIEAMACGTAVITTPYGTEDYAIDGHTAIVARPRVISRFRRRARWAGPLCRNSGSGLPATGARWRKA